MGKWCRLSRGRWWSSGKRRKAGSSRADVRAGAQKNPGAWHVPLCQVQAGMKEGNVGRFAFQMQPSRTAAVNGRERRVRDQTVGRPTVLDLTDSNVRRVS